MRITVRRRPVLLLAPAAVLAAVTFTVWLSVRGEEASEALVVDERAGVLRGVSFGDTAVEVRARLGDEIDDEDGFFPAGSDYTGPPAIPSPRSDRGSRIPPEELHFEDTAYLASPTVGVFSMATLSDGARTRGGVAIGDYLSDVRAAYPRVECGEAVAGEPLFGSDIPTYPWCRARVGDVDVFFGADPIESITLTSYARGG